MTSEIEETLDSSPSLPPSSPSPTTPLKLQNPNSPYSSPSSIRLWRPAAQRNLRNQWSKFASFKNKWLSLSSTARSHATSLVNAYLSQRYMPAIELGVLSDMPDIRKKACQKLFKQQELHGSKLLSFYKDMVVVVTDMINTSRSLRCFHKGASNSPLLQFSSQSKDKSDSGDGEGIPVFTFWSISTFESLAQELVQMFESELNLKRLVVMELLSVSAEEAPHLGNLCWSDELYSGEFDDLGLCNFYSKEANEPLPPIIDGCKSDTPLSQPNHKLDSEVLQVYLTTWLAEVNIDTYRMDEIFAIVGEEMHVSLS